MRLKSLKLAGFKSFVEPTTIDFPHNLTVLVGPNGCGKSNVVDAIRLVIGESQASHLRGDSLSDVIFDGAKTRAPLGLATIELVFDNSDHTIKGSYANFTEISIKREILRDSPSKFYLNGKRCRRRDIQDLFLGSGFGARSYSVVEQGFIGRIVTAKPDELRGHLEEAAGVSKYRERRRETERKIASTHENLERVRDHSAELFRQLTHLQRQAAEAARYTQLMERQRVTQAKLNALKVRSIQHEIEEQKNLVDEASLAVNRVQARIQTTRTAIDSLRADETEAIDNFNERQSESFQARSELSRLEDLTRRSSQLVEDSKVEIESLETRIKKLTQDLVCDQNAIQENQKSLGKADAERDEARKQADAVKERFEAKQNEAKEWQTLWNELITRTNETNNQVQLKQDELERSREELKSIRSASEQLKGIIEQELVLDDVEPMQQRLTKMQDSLGEALEKASELEHNLQLLETQDSQDDAQRNSLEERIREVRDERSALAAKLDSELSRVQDQDSQSERLSKLLEHPRVAESIEIQLGWERATEVVLGDYLKGLVVSSLTTEVEKIKEEQPTDLVLAEKSQTEDLDESSLLTAITKGREFVGALSMFSGVYRAETLDEALNRRLSLQPYESVITKSGVWIGKSWIKFGLKQSTESTVFEKQAELERLETKLEDLESRYQGVLARISQRTKRKAQLREQSRLAQESISSDSEWISEFSSQIERKRYEFREFTTQRERALEESISHQERHTELASRIEDHERTIPELLNAQEELGDLRTRLQKQEQENNQALEDTLQEERSLRNEFHQLDLQVNDLRAKQESISRDSERNQEELERSRKRLTLLSEVVKDEQNKLQTLEQERDQAVQIVASAEERLTKLRAERDRLTHQVREQSALESRQQIELEGTQQKLGQEREAHIKLTSQEDHLMSQFHQTEYNFDQANELIQPSDTEDALNRTLSRLHNRIEKLGGVNLAAERDLQLRSEEHKTYESRIKDLEISQETLQQAIEKIDQETTKLFTDTLRKANERFQVLFAKLFGGGEAQLVLTDKDPLVSGVTMKIQPPGKQNKNVSQLSLGEKAMSALAFTFAMFELNPSPLCVLDEVDAPLDASNVSRFANMIKEMSTSIQFLVISHSRGTMQSAESLIGITMQEAGVSQLISVNLN